MRINNKYNCEFNPRIKRKLQKICQKIVIQGPCHPDNITEYYRIIQEAARNEFTEDNKPTLELFLQECWENANKRWD